ncbi:hypothetical protein LTR84_007079 [Exophiala bonariae]|uniref:Cytochrome P450 oxidoreductase n=1 Tax=Exophiala bonariae TaxID=1690606 RepID=A0AAV9MZM0_9EURO|nr:hypothetical protein LTR84_007079 [Exophiala bonariae]
MSLIWLVVPFALGWLVYHFRWSFNAQLSRIPGPVSARFSRLYRLSMVANGRAPQEYKAAHDRYGSIVRLGPKHVSIADPAAIPVIYGVGSKFLKSDFYGLMTPVYRGRRIDSMFTARSNEVHKALKSPVAQYFSMTGMKAYEPYVDECTEIFMSAMRGLEGQTVDIAVWLQWYAFDVIASITFQRRFGFLEQARDIDDMIARLDRGLQVVKYISSYPELGVVVRRFLGPLLSISGQKDPLVGFLDLCDEEIARYDQSSNEQSSRTDFLSQLRQKKMPLGPGTPDENMINHLSNNLLAGSDTTGISLRACFYYILNNPAVLHTMRKEFDTSAAAGSLSDNCTLEEVLKLPYLQAVIKEAMRLHPGVGFPLERYVLPAGATICGVKLPAGTIVSMSASVVQLDEKVFGADAAEFRPERWLDGEQEQIKLMDRSLLVFGHGARSCIGKNISLMEMSKFITQVLRSFDLVWAKPKHEWATETAWFWKQTDMPVVFKRREA